MGRMDHRGTSPDAARLRQVRDELRGVRPRAVRRETDPTRLQDGWPLEVRRRRLVDEIDRELRSEGDDAGSLAAPAVDTRRRPVYC